MTTGLDWISDVLSPARFAPYLALFDGQVEPAVELYKWNIDVSSAFYAPLHCLEVALRNAEHRELTTQFRRPDWWNAPELEHNVRPLVDAVEEKAQPAPRGTRTRTTDDTVAELTFGFWVTLVSRRYDGSLWRQSLHRAFPHFAGERQDPHRDLNTMRLFRNRIMHYEPIHHRHLAADHATVLRLLGYLSPDLARELRLFDRVPAVLARRPPRSTRRGRR